MREVTIIVVTYKAPESLAKCLRAVLRHTHDVPYRVVVMDNGPRGRLGGIRRIFEREPRIVFHSMHGNIGKAAAINRAVKEFPSEWYLTLDDDAIVAEGWLSDLLKAARRGGPKTAIVGCRLLQPDGRLYAAEMIYWESTLAHQERDLGLRDYERFCESVCGACMLIRGCVFKSIRFHEPLRQHFDDGDFCLQARSHGWRVLYCGTTAVVHRHLDRGDARKLDGARRMMERRWGVPLFADSHPIDRLYALIWRADIKRDWGAVVAAADKLRRIDPAPAYAWFWSGVALLHLRKPKRAVKILRAALSEPYLSDSFRAKIELMTALAIRQASE
jgi:GT2 family glycosyltransferase